MWNLFLTRFKKLNFMMLLAMLGLITLGVFFVYSACSIRAESELRLLYLRHLEVGVLGLLLYFCLAWIDYRRLIRRWSWLLYLLCFTLVALVPFFGSVTMNARRWLFGIQPSEPMKLAIIALLAWFLSRKKEHGITTFILAIMVVALPLVLILMQPDLGTALVLLPTLFTMLFVARITPRLLWFCVLSATVVVALIFGIIIKAEDKNLPPARREALLAQTHLKPHQIRRLQVFLFPDKDLHGSGYNRRQSEISVGSGGRTGKGWRQGEQYTLGYLPPSVSANDFIFAVLAEELGYRGSLLVLTLFGLLLASAFWIGLRCKDDTGRLFVTGVVTLTFSHMFINIAMTIGRMPITGLPLPYISYGRTFMMTMIAAYGLVQSVSIHGRKTERHF